MPPIESEKIELLLNAILSDERKHHEFLKKVIEVLDRKETITKYEWWNILWSEALRRCGLGG